MRIALLTTSYPSEPGDPSGHFVATEALALAREGHDVHVIAPGRRASVRVAERDRGPVTVWGAGGSSLFGWPGALPRARENPLRLFGLVRFRRSAARLLRALAPLDRTIAHFLVPCGYPLALEATGELDVVLHGSDVRVALAFPSPARAHLVRSLIERGARFRFASHDLFSRLLAGLAPRDQERLTAASRVELPPIDVPPCQPASAADDAQHARPKWVVCSRLLASKRVDRAIREASRQSAELTIIGDGPIRAELEALAASFEPRARFVGRLARQEALALIARSHKLVHLSEAEGAPTVIREARALGVSVLATPVGDVPRWALEDSGIEIFRPM